MKKTNKNLNKTNLNSNFQFLTSDHRGITLIALVITIIVMLILVAVTINMAINGGLFGYAGNAVRETKTAIDQEGKLGNVEGGLTVDELIEKFTTEEDTTPNIHTWTRTGDTFTCSHCNVSYTMGDVVTYSPNTGKTETVVKGEKSGYLAMTNSNKVVASKEISREILLAAGEAESAGGGGIPGGKAELADPTYKDQTITRESLTWIVLGLDKNGVLLITTSTPTTGVLNLRGALSYINGPSIMNTVCKELYSNSTYGNARSINIDDINLALNWTDTRGMVFPVSGDDPYKVATGTKFGDVGTNKMTQADWDAIKSNNQTPETGKALTDYEINGYFYEVDGVAGATTLEKQTVLAGDEDPYWLASRGVNAVALNSCALFGPGHVGKGGVYSSNELFVSDGYGNGRSLGLRPVVSLKSELPAKANS